MVGESAAPRSSISYASRHAQRASRSSGRGGRHTTVPLESGSGTTSCDEIECVQPLGSIQRHIGAIEFQFRPCLTYLFERSRQARDRTSAPFHGSACQFSRVFRRLQQEHAVPAVCRDTDHTVVAKGTRVVCLAWQPLIGQPRTPHIRTQEHRAVTMQSEECFEQRCVGCCEGTLLYHVVQCARKSARRLFQERCGFVDLLRQRLNRRPQPSCTPSFDSSGRFSSRPSRICGIVLTPYPV